MKRENIPDSSAREIFKKNLHRISSLRGMSQMDIANGLKLPQTTVSSWFVGKSYPRVDAMQRLADLLDVHMRELTTEDCDELQDDVWAIRERLRRDPSYRLLFDAAGKATPEHLRAAAAMLKALEGQEDAE